MMDRLLELAARCEEATGPDRVLDAEVFVVARDTDNWDALNRDGSVADHTPPYTASIDAAKTLVPEGRAVELALVPVGHSHAAVILAEPETWAKGFAVSGALALCAASLRARAITEGQGHDPD